MPPVVLERVPQLLMATGLVMVLAGALNCVGEPAPGAEEPAASVATAGGEGTPTAVPPSAADAGGDAADTVEDASAPAPVRPPQQPLVTPPWPALSPLTPRAVEGLRAIAARGPRMRDDVFAKLGGSSVVSHAFLHCFRGDDVVLGEHPELAETIDYFAHGRAAGTSPFTRESLATHEGWSIRHGLTGRPTRVEQEVRAISPRYAFALFGGNDVEARRPRTFHRNLVRLVDKLTRLGVIPILGATMPRGDSAEMESWARRYDEVSRAVALSRGLPYMDVHSVAASLPNEGLAHDGVHPNVYLEGGHSRACDFSAQGLQRGQNQRNLLAIRTLDRLRRVLTAGEPAPDADLPALRGDGSAEAPVEVERLPFAEWRAEGSPSAAQERGQACAPERSVTYPERRYRLIVAEAVTVHVWAFTREGETLAIQLYAEDGAARCVSLNGDGHAELTAGTWVFGIEIPDDEEFTFSISVADPSGGSRAR